MSSDLDENGAIIDGEYRYLLWRKVYLPGCIMGRLLWVLLNPSTATEEVASNDATVKKTMGFARRWKFGENRIVNAYALRSRHPSVLWTHPAPIGPKNDRTIALEARRADRIVVAWGGDCDPARALQVMQLLRSSTPERIYCLGYTKGGQPRHPLMLSYDTEPAVMEERRAA